MKALTNRMSKKEEEEGADDADFEEEDEGETEFYDFTEPMRNPETLIKFENQR